MFLVGNRNDTLPIQYMIGHFAFDPFNHTLNPCCTSREATRKSLNFTLGRISNHMHNISWALPMDYSPFPVDFATVDRFFYSQSRGFALIHFGLGPHAKRFSTRSDGLVDDPRVGQTSTDWTLNLKAW